MIPAVECHGLSKTYRTGGLFRRRSVCAVDGAGFLVRPGEVVGLIGPNGAGKTTLMAIAAGLIFADRGMVSVFGHRPRSVEARRCLAYMPETPVFLDPYTGQQMLEYHGALAGLTQREAAHASSGLLERLGLVDAADRPTRTYSQGMKQRLALAVALIRRPRLLLLDEPGNGLDPPGVLKLREILREESSKETAVLISSHRLSELEKLTPHYLFLNKGRILRVGDESPCGDLRVRVEFAPGGAPADAWADAWDVLEASVSHVLVRLPDRSATPELVRALVAAQAAIVAVTPLQPSVEETFMQLYEGKAQ